MKKAIILSVLGLAAAGVVVYRKLTAAQGY